MPELPRDQRLESTLALHAEGYLFIPRRCRRYRSDAFLARLMLQDTICMSGAAAAELFYDEQRFQRAGAAPVGLNRTLFGRGGVQSLDDDAHRDRKRMLMALMTPEHIRRLVDLAGEQWEAEVGRWAQGGEVNLFSATEKILARAVCRWSGLPLGDLQADERARDFGQMIAGAGAFGPPHWRARRARRRAERWVGDTIEAVRARELDATEGTALHAIAWHRDPHGNLLARHAATADLLSVLRPTVAVDRFIVFMAHALHEHPRLLPELRANDEAIEPFVQEVRRYYPFFPFAAALVREAFEWRGYRFPRGTRVLLDLYGTNRDPRLWDKPEAFRPGRFRQWQGDAYSFIPQGGGDHYSDHRCAGEWLTIELMKDALRRLTRSMEYEVPAQDLSINLSRMPALPESGFLIRDVRRASGAGAAALQPA